MIVFETIDRLLLLLSIERWKVMFNLVLVIFPPHIMGEENHNLRCVFFPKVCQISTLLLHLVNSSHHGAVGSASAWQTRGRGFEPVLMRYSLRGKYPGA